VGYGYGGGLLNWDNDGLRPFLRIGAHERDRNEDSVEHGDDASRLHCCDDFESFGSLFQFVIYSWPGIASRARQRSGWLIEIQQLSYVLTGSCDSVLLAPVKLGMLRRPSVVTYCRKKRRKLSD
jgi:hypothetical protein